MEGNIEWYYKKINDDTTKVLSKKVKRDILILLSFPVMSLIGTALMIYGLIYSFCNRSEISSSTYSMGIIILVLATLIVFMNDNIKPLKKMNINDTIFCWLYHLLVKLEKVLKKR